jgi:hypothetical protein
VDDRFQTIHGLNYCGGSAFVSLHFLQALHYLPLAAWSDWR